MIWWERLTVVVNYQNIYQEKKKEEFDQVLQEKDEWLNSEGYDSNFEKYEQHLNDLKAYGDPLKKRDEELKKKTCFNQYLNKYNKWV